MAEVEGTFWDRETKCQIGEACSGRRRPYDGEPEDFFEQMAALRAAKGLDKYGHRVVIRRLWYGLYGGRGTRVRRPPHDKLYRGKTEEERRKEKTFIPERKKTEADFTGTSGRKGCGNRR